MIKLTETDDVKTEPIRVVVSVTFIGKRVHERHPTISFNNKI